MSRSPLDESKVEDKDSYERHWAALVEMVREGRSFSGLERNCCFLNLGQDRFADVSSVLGLDHVDDSRSVAAVDWDFDGDLDLWMTNRTSPRLRFLRNDVARGHRFLALRLHGTQSNRDAVGTRVEVRVSGQSAGVLAKTLRAGTGFLTQSGKTLHFGLGDAETVDRIVVRWPNGQTQEFTMLAADRVYGLTQDSREAIPLETPAQVTDMKPAPVAPLPAQDGLRLGMVSETRMPALRYKNWDLQPVELQFPRESPLLINLWAHWCTPCLSELREFSERSGELENSNVEILALTIDGVSDVRSAAVQKSRNYLDKIGFQFNSGIATLDSVEKLSLLQLPFLDASHAETLPTSFLITPQGSLAAIYKGPVDVGVLARDVRQISAAGSSPPDLGIQFPGRWYQRPRGRDLLITLAAHFDTSGFAADSLVYSKAALAIDPDSELAKFNYNAAQKRVDELRQQADEFAASLRGDPSDAVAHYNLGLIRRKQGRVSEALAHYESALKADPGFVLAHINLGSLLAREGEMDAALAHLHEALRIDPGNAMATRNIELIERAREAAR